LQLLKTPRLPRIVTGPFYKRRQWTQQPGLALPHIRVPLTSLGGYDGESRARFLAITPLSTSSQNIYKASVVTWHAVWMNGYAWQTARRHCGQDVADALPVNVD
jgi:hypothetical protein